VAILKAILRLYHFQISQHSKGRTIEKEIVRVSKLLTESIEYDNKREIRYYTNLIKQLSDALGEL